MPENDPALVLSMSHVSDARILPSRTDILELLPKNIVFAEVGVALGTFTSEILKRCGVDKFIAIDIFELHRWPETWGGEVGRTLNGQSHLAFYRHKFRDQISQKVMDVLVGDSVEMLGTLPDCSADVIYLDSDHSYEQVSRELDVARRKVKDDGYIILNDYIMFDYLTGLPYGVVQASHEFMIRYNWKMTHLALHPQMFCDIVLKKI
jgi:hypothetical protein